MGIITAPVLLDSNHSGAGFDCGEISLNEWLRTKALKNQLNGASRTFVVSNKNDSNIIGFYCLSTGSIQHKQLLSNRLKRNMPDPVPVIFLGRLAVDCHYKRRGIGAGLLKDAILRAKSVSNHFGAKALLVHTLSDEAKAFYVKFGFIESGIQSRTLLLPLW